MLEVGLNYFLIERDYCYAGLVIPEYDKKKLELFDLKSNFDDFDTKSIELKFPDHLDEGQKTDADVTTVYTRMIFLNNEILKMESILNKYGKLVPFIFKEKFIYLYWIKNSIDAVDYEKSKLNLAPYGYIRSFERIILKNDVIDENEIFCLPKDNNIVFISKKIKEQFEYLKITKGIRFRLIEIV